MALKLRTYRLGTPRKKGEGLRLGTVRFLPRGVRKADYARRDFFDVWFPTVAPSQGLVRWLRSQPDLERAWPTFVRRYRKEMQSRPESRQAIALLAQVAQRTPIAVGCFCEDEAHCHRSILRELIEAQAGDAA
jgi:uncharacterized protein YeaO (DUF488 family)